MTRWPAQLLASGRHAAPGYRAIDHFLEFDMQNSPE
jgi:hypothetical protein